MKSKKVTNKRIIGLKTKVNRSFLFKSKKETAGLLKKQGQPKIQMQITLFLKSTEIYLMNQH